MTGMGNKPEILTNSAKNDNITLILKIGGELNEEYPVFCYYTRV